MSAVSTSPAMVPTSSLSRRCSWLREIAPGWDDVPSVFDWCGADVGPGASIGMNAETSADPRGRAGVRPGSFEEFYAGAADSVYRALAVALADAFLAREARDEAMARAYARWDEVMRCANPPGWVFRVGFNWATSWQRKLRRERPLTDRDGWPGAVPHRVDPTDPDLTGALLRLPVTQRAVVVCRFLFDLDTAETAEVLAVAEGTVRSRLSRAMAALRTDLTEEDR
jgi:DNA-directed RNA polymerase specialized sigma24 family protein